MSKEKTVSFDVFDTTTKAEAGIEIPILKADGDESGLFITVLGTDSATYQKLSERNDRNRLRVLSKGGKSALDNIYDSAKKNDFELVADCTTAWRHENGAMPHEVSDKDALIEFYVKYPLVFEQVRRAMTDRSNFTKA